MSETQIFHSHTFSNGLTLLGEKMEQVSSVAVSVLVPLGSANDPKGFEGSAAILGEMFNKGAGSWNSVELSQQYEDLGIHKSNSAGTEVSIFGMAMLSENLKRGLELLKIQLLEPSFPVEEIASVKSLALQELKALEDEPSSLAMQKLSEHFYSAPFNKSHLGTVAGIEAVTIDSLRDYYSSRFTPSPSVISIAGDFDWEQVVKDVESVFGSWSGSCELLPLGAFGTEQQEIHIEKDTSQVQIAFAYPSITYGHPLYYVSKVANGVLSGGMAGRLFIEVREKRGLVYRVSSSHSAGRGRAGVFAVAGTTPENAEETLQVMFDEIRGLAKGASDDEIARSKADIKSRIVMQSESSSSRASSLINDWWNLGRIRTIEEIKQGIDSVTSDDIQKYYKQCPVSPTTLVALGPKSLKVPK